MSPERRAALIGVSAMVLLSVNFPAGRHALMNGLGPFDLVAIRYAVAGLLFLPVLLRLGLGPLTPARALILALLGGVPYYLQIAIGLTFSPAAHAAVLNPGGTTVFGLLIGHAVAGTRPGTPTVAAVIAMLVGLVMVASPGVGAGEAPSWIGDLLFATSGLTWAIYGVLLRQWNVGGVRGTAIITCASLVWLPFHAAVFGFEAITTNWQESLIQCVAQGLLAGGIGIMMYSHAISVLGATRGAFLPPLVPTLGILQAAILLGEQPRPIQIAGAALVVFAMLGAALSSARPPPAPRAT